jgi:hypothetical protein
MAEELLETITMNHLDPRRRRKKRPKHNNSSPCTGKPDLSIYLGTSSLLSLRPIAHELAFVVVAVVLFVFARSIYYKRARNHREKRSEVEMGEKM